MPHSSTDKMLESMMMQILNPNQNAANVVCCNCFKVKKKGSQRSSNTRSKCRENNAPRKHKKRRRTLNKSCLRTIICLTKMAKYDGECQGCSSDPCCGNMGQDVDERFCSKCGQLLPGLTPADQTMNQPDRQCLEQLQRCQQECKDMAVQVDVDRKEPLSVRIKVCPCPNVDSRNQDEKLHQSVSLPELSSTNPRLVEDASSRNLVSSRGPRTQIEDSNYEESGQSQLLMKRITETIPEWPVDIASIKKLALNVAKARLVEEASCWEREYARRYLQQERQKEMEQQDEQPTDEPSAVVDPRKSVKADGSSEVKRRSYVSFEDGESPTGPSTLCFKAQKGTQTYPNYNQPDMGICDEYPGVTDFGVSYTPTQGTTGGCCTGTGVYCFTPENGPSPYGDHCEHACTCRNSSQFQPYGWPYPGYQYPNEFGMQDRSRPDLYNVSYGSLGSCHSCR